MRNSFLMDVKCFREYLLEHLGLLYIIICWGTSVTASRLAVYYYAREFCSYVSGTV